ncbi:MAG: pyruvate dehydrogenase component (dihydrolipoamide acetyltransferase), partial [Blastocatellia bacterium]|nr:pyruvate dehydrogenase component (dihydrolipoamide acetyltransferase) [Blastocatellia bacterium]
MPQMGESIAEGTITKWLKQVGETVERDEPLFEISTDKVDAEIPSPAAGTLTEIKVKEGETVEINTVVAVLNGGDGAPAAEPKAAEAQTPAASSGNANAYSNAAQSAVESQPPPTPAPTSQPSTATSQQQPAAQTSTQASTAQPTTQAAQPAQAEVAGRSYDEQRPGAKQEGAQSASAASDNGGEQTAEELRRAKSSPLVRNIAREHGIDISRLEGTGMSGRVTKNDILSFIESGAAMSPQQAMQGGAATTAPQTTSAQAAAQTTTAQASVVQPAAEDRVEQMSVMRRKIAEHMVMSRRTSAHVTTVYEIDMTSIAKLRDKHKAEFQQRTGTKLTF